MRKYGIAIVLLVVLVSGFVVNAAGQEAEEKYRVLFIDESTSFEISMRVQGLVGGLKGREELDVVAKTAEVQSPTENPIDAGEVSGMDLVIIVPPTIETGQLNQVWIITRPLSVMPVESRGQAVKRLAQLKDAIHKAFSGTVNPVGVEDDVIPAYFSTLYLREGILR